MTTTGQKNKEQEILPGKNSETLFSKNSEILAVKNSEILSRAPKERINGVLPLFLENDGESRISTFVELYEKNVEPWDYSKKAIEWERFDYVKNEVAKIVSSVSGPARILDLGCAFGQLTTHLLDLGAEVWALELSPRAALEAHHRLGSRAHVVCGSSTDLSFFLPNSFDCVVLSDGLVGWEISDPVKLKVLREVERVLKPGGYALLTDYLSPKAFEGHVALVKQGPLVLRRKDYLGDRLGFQLWANFRNHTWIPGVRTLMASKSFAKWSTRVSKKLGPRFSKHLGLLLQKT